MTLRSKKDKSAFTLIELLCVLFLIAGIFTFIAKQYNQYNHALRPKQTVQLVQGLVHQVQAAAMTQAHEGTCSITISQESTIKLQIEGPLHGSLLSLPSFLRYQLNGHTEESNQAHPLWAFDKEGKCINPGNRLTLIQPRKKPITLTISSWGIVSQAS